MLDSDLSLLVEAARRGGEIAQNFFRNAPQAWEKSKGAGPVTEADLAVNADWVTFLRKARPDYGWLSEETEDNLDRLTHKRVFILDPIDGTRSFIEGSPHWAHSLAIAEGGTLVCAAVFLPMLDMMFTASAQSPTALNGALITVSPSDTLNGATILSTKANFSPHHWRGGLPHIKRHFRPSLAYRLCLVAQGAFDGMLTLRPTWEWDVAAGHLIVENAGGVVTCPTGAIPPYNRADPRLPGLIAAPLPLHCGLLQGLNG